MTIRVTEPTPSHLSESLTPVENLCQPRQAADKRGELEDNDFEFEDDDLDYDDSEELDSSRLPRGKQELGAAGTGANKGSDIRPTKEGENKTGEAKK